MVIWTRYRNESGWKSRFYASRALRIYPLYLLFFLLTAMFFGEGQLSYYVHSAHWNIALLWLFNNIAILGQDALRFFYFNPLTHHLMVLPPGEADRAALVQHEARIGLTLLPQSWTLAIELYFYLLAPYLLLRRTTALVLGVIMLIALRLTIGYSFEFQPEWRYGFFPSELAVFLSGALAYRVYLYFFQSGRIALALARLRFAKGERSLFVLSALSVISACMVYLTVDLNFLSTYMPASLSILNGSWDAPLGAPTGYWLVIMMTVLVLPFAFHLSGGFSWDRYLGELSYPLYICHGIIVSLISEDLQKASDKGRAFTGILVLFTSIIASIALVRLVEMPIDRVRHGLSKAKTDPGMARQKPRH